MKINGLKIQFLLLFKYSRGIFFFFYFSNILEGYSIIPSKDTGPHKSPYLYPVPSIKPTDNNYLFSIQIKWIDDHLTALGLKRPNIPCYMLLHYLRQQVEYLVTYFNNFINQAFSCNIIDHVGSWDQALFSIDQILVFAN